MHHVTSLRAVPSIGIAYINAALTNDGHNVQVIDAPGEALLKYRKIQNSNLTINGLTAKEICARINHEVQLIGVSAMHDVEWVYDKFIIKTLNQHFPHAKIFLGGENATGSCDAILNDPELNISLIVLGEADKIAPLIVNALINNEPLDGLSGIAFKNSAGKIIKTNRDNNIRDVDSLPFPRWDGIPLENYFRSKTGISSHAEKSLTMVATRGCPHACTFCTVPNMWNSKWFPRTPENVIAEMEYNIEKFGITHIDFVDLTFATNFNWTLKFCEILKEKKLNIKWSLPIGTRTESLTPELLKLMREVGCQRILFSPESGSKLTLKRINKKLKITDMNRAIQGSLDAGIVVKLATIFGFPGQTKQEAAQSLWFIFIAALKGVHDVVCLCFVPYPGTALRDQLVQSGEFIPDQTPTRLNNDIKDMTSWSKFIPKWSVRYITLFGMALFYGTQFLVRPNRIYIAIKNIFFKKQPVTNFESLIYCLFYRPSIQIEETEELQVSTTRPSISLISTEV